MIQNREHERGFTLMELLIVIVLLGFLIAMGMASFKSSQTKSRDSRRKSDLHQIMIALETYFNDKGRYPSDSADGKIMGCGTGDSQECPWGGQFSDANGTIYMVTLPDDPGLGKRYFYDVSGALRTTYQLYARLENKEDISVAKSGSDPGKYVNVFCDDGSSIECNYGIASTNTTPGTGRSIAPDP